MDVIIGVRKQANTHKDISKAIYQGKDISTFFLKLCRNFDYNLQSFGIHHYQKIL